MVLEQMLKKAVEKGASDIFVVAGLPISFKIEGEILPQEEERMMPADTERLMREVYTAASGRDFDLLWNRGDDDFSFSVREIGRFRVNAYRQRGSLAAVIRVVLFDLPDSASLGIPDVVMELSRKTKGMVLVTGPAGSGKSTTLSCLVDRINTTRNCHVLTLEDPIEYLHRHKKSIVSQREITVDTQSYSQALRSALRQSPDVILIGEMRDQDTIEIAMTAAETGHLVLSTLHTVGAANTIDRIIDAFPPEQQHQARIQLSMVLQAVVSQQLIPSSAGGQIPAFEIMTATPAIRSMIRDAKIHQIDSVIYSSAEQGMRTMDSDLLRLHREGLVGEEDALLYSVNQEMMMRNLSRR
ncbi:MAG: PilT/PilU family type 4a pilus ATPase [Oscillospiraceae bacterium]|nr:PilT/PilU family type 4a pilus ATPase [Oscillospiraceae bacterium]MDY4190832.1 PilT/PilU family type 4a pilus ATPase [Oscillospiraceae bacterium]